MKRWLLISLIVVFSTVAVLLSILTFRDMVDVCDSAGIPSLRETQEVPLCLQAREKSGRQKDESFPDAPRLA